MPLVRITQERSKIRCLEKHKRTLAALGLRRINHFVIHEDTPQIRGMVHLVRYLVRMEPAEGGKKRVKALRREKMKAAPAAGDGKRARAALGLNIKGKKRVPRS